MTAARATGRIIVNVIAAVALLCGVSCTNQCLGIPDPPLKTDPGPRPKPADRGPDLPAPDARLHRSFRVGRLLLSGKAVTVDNWQRSDEVVRKPKVTIVVAASWCPHCQDYISQLGRMAPGTAPIDFIVFYEDEVSRYLDGAEANGQLSPEQRAAVEADFDARDQRLINPEPLAYFLLNYHFIESGEFDDLVTGYPTLITCDPDGCEKIRK